LHCIDSFRIINLSWGEASVGATGLGARVKRPIKTPVALFDHVSFSASASFRSNLAASKNSSFQIAIFSRAQIISLLPVLNSKSSSIVQLSIVFLDILRLTLELLQLVLKKICSFNCFYKFIIPKRTVSAK